MVPQGTPAPSPRANRAAHRLPRAALQAKWFRLRGAYVGAGAAVALSSGEPPFDLILHRQVAVNTRLSSGTSGTRDSCDLM